MTLQSIKDDLAALDGHVNTHMSLISSSGTANGSSANTTASAHFPSSSVPFSEFLEPHRGAVARVESEGFLAASDRCSGMGWLTAL